MLTIKISIFFLAIRFFSGRSLGVSRARLTGGASTQGKDPDQKCNGSDSFHVFKVRFLIVSPTLSEDILPLD
ncbi:hypothetical protein Aconfl_10260 [Algoriphagus confluentis]|uniref:Secreted protein n=1 Tax=Algoriphagus confluentis TaxID=1697556 RepID=A0ABQ6PKW6_9BACT|nr:hypothetical protein Aconfl_10260 [Algoriphagus confluentis]